MASHKKKASLLRKSVWTVSALTGAFAVFLLLGNLLPSPKPHAACPALPAAVLTVTHGHVAVVSKVVSASARELVIVDTGTRPASAVFTLSELGIMTSTVRVTNIETGRTSTPVAGIKVTLLPQSSKIYTVE